MDVVLLRATANAGEKPMAETIKEGAILIREDALLPESLRFESERCTKGWRLVRNLGGHQLDQAISRAGWNFFYMAGEIEATAFGFDEEKALRRAVNRVLTNPESEKFNSLEIAQVAANRFLGLPYVTVTAHPRHIQESVVLFHAQRHAQWDRANLAAA